jgi:hypothetical protein
VKIQGKEEEEKKGVMGARTFRTRNATSRLFQTLCHENTYDARLGLEGTLLRR